MKVPLMEVDLVEPVVVVMVHEVEMVIIHLPILVVVEVDHIMALLVMVEVV